MLGLLHAASVFQRGSQLEPSLPFSSHLPAFGGPGGCLVLKDGHRNCWTFTDNKDGATLGRGHQVLSSGHRNTQIQDTHNSGTVRSQGAKWGTRPLPPKRRTRRETAGGEEVDAAMYKGQVRGASPTPSVRVCALRQASSATEAHHGPGRPLGHPPASSLLWQEWCVIVQEQK